MTLTTSQAALDALPLVTCITVYRGAFTLDRVCVEPGCMPSRGLEGGHSHCDLYTMLDSKKCIKRVLSSWLAPDAFKAAKQKKNQEKRSKIAKYAERV